MMLWLHGLLDIHMHFTVSLAAAHHVNTKGVMWCFVKLKVQCLSTHSPVV